MNLRDQQSKVKSRTKQKASACKIKHARQINEDTDSKGGMQAESDDDIDYETDQQLQLTNLNTISEKWEDWDEDMKVQGKQPSERTTATGEWEWKFIPMLPPGIRIDQNSDGRLIFRRGDYGVLVTKEEVSKCVAMVVQNRSIEEIADVIEIEILYNSSVENLVEQKGKDCAELALLGTISPQLNSYRGMQTRGGRDEITDVIEKVMIPSTQKYTPPEKFYINQRAQERMVHRDHTIEYLEQTVSSLRGTMDTEVDQERWMYATGAETVVEASPNVVAYWQGIGIYRWIALKLWSWSAARETRETYIKNASNKWYYGQVLDILPSSTHTSTT
jgi:hypothetical protein